MLPSEPFCLLFRKGTRGNTRRLCGACGGVYVHFCVQAAFLLREIGTELCPLINYNPSICRPVPNDKGITLADTLKRGSAKGSSETRRPRKGQERTSAPCPADRSRIPCICPERQHEKYKLRDFFRGMHTRREALCGSVRRFPVPGGSFPVEQVKRLTRAYSVRKC